MFDRDAYLRLTAIMLERTCPLTNGRQLRITKEGFIRACQGKQREARAWIVNNNVRERGRTKTGKCLACRGQQVPSEVVFLDSGEVDQIAAGVAADLAALRHREELVEQTTIEQEQDMGAKRKCESCGLEKTNLSQCSGDLVCSTCASLYGSVRHRLPAIAAAVRKYGQEQALLSALGLDTAVAVSVESELLERMAKLVGYTGTSGDELVDAIERAVGCNTGLAADHAAADAALGEVCRAVGIDRDHDGLTYQGIVDAVRAAVEQAGGAPACASCPECAGMIDVSRHVGASLGTESGQVVKMVAHSEAILDELSLLVGAIEPAEIARAVASLIHAHDKMRDRNDELALGLSALSERISELESDGLRAEQVFAQLREVVGNDALDAAELPSAVDAMLRKASGHPASMLMPRKVVGESSLDSHLLDLDLDAMRGQITGLDPDRIAMLREAV